MSVKSGLRQTFANVRFRVHTHIGRLPWLFFGLHGLLGDKQLHAVGPTTELVIEGVPRVASTYCVVAFLVAQDHPVDIAMHTHLPANVLRAMRRKIPTLVLIREPREAIRSTLLQNRSLTLAAALERYYHFYRLVEPLRKTLVVADFEEVITDFGAVIERLNTRFGTNFKPYEKTRDNEEKVKAYLLARDASKGLDALRSYRPSSQKDLAKASIEVESESAWLHRCEALYQRLSPLVDQD